MKKTEVIRETKEFKTKQLVDKVIIKKNRKIRICRDIGDNKYICETTARL